jgi:hypothetical protein
MIRAGEFVPVLIRRARKAHRCARCDQEIDTGDLYEERNLPPRRHDCVDNDHWLRSRSHLGAWPGETGCDEAAAYREKAEREALIYA